MAINSLQVVFLGACGQEQATEKLEEILEAVLGSKELLEPADTGQHSENNTLVRWVSGNLVAKFRQASTAEEAKILGKVLTQFMEHKHQEYNGDPARRPEWTSLDTTLGSQDKRIFMIRNQEPEPGS